MRTLAALAAAALGSGCLYVPYHAAVPGSRLAPDEQSLDVLRGAATREEVLLRLGEPDWAASRDRVFVYTWQSEWGTVLYASPYGGPAGVEPVRGRKHFLVLEFDEAGLLQRAETKTAFRTPAVQELLRDIDAR